MLGQSGTLPLSLLIMTASGLMTGFINIHVSTMLQLSVESEMRGRVIALMTTAASGLAPLGMVLGGTLGDLLPVPVVYAICGGIATVSAVLFCLSRESRDFSPRLDEWRHLHSSATSVGRDRHLLPVLEEIAAVPRSGALRTGAGCAACRSWRRRRTRRGTCDRPG